MTTHTDGGRNLASYGRPCPVCNGSTYRIPRRLVDLLVSIFTPVHRFRCRSMSCSWEGNIREKGTGLLNTLKEK
jgi:hypothetical protein